MNYYLEAFKKYAEFNGRTSRKGFWMFVLFNIIVSILIGIIDNIFNLKFSYGVSGAEQGLLGNVYNLVLFIPSIAIGIRRMHDINHSGWWIIFPIVNLFMFTTKGTVGENKYGPAPIEPISTPKPEAPKTETQTPETPKQ